MVQVVDQGARVLGFDDNIIDVSLDEVIAYLVAEALLNSALISGSGVFESERHSGVTIRAKGSDEGSFDLVVFL